MKILKFLIKGNWKCVPINQFRVNKKVYKVFNGEISNIYKISLNFKDCEDKQAWSQSKTAAMKQKHLRG